MNSLTQRWLPGSPVSIEVHVIHFKMEDSVLISILAGQGIIIIIIAIVFPVSCIQFTRVLAKKCVICLRI